MAQLFNSSFLGKQSPVRRINCARPSRSTEAQFTINGPYTIVLQERAFVGDAGLRNTEPSQDAACGPNLVGEHLRVHDNCKSQGSARSGPDKRRNGLVQENGLKEVMRTIQAGLECAKDDDLPMLLDRQRAKGRGRD